MLKVKEDIKNFENLLVDAVKAGSQAFVWDISGDEIIRVPVKLKTINSFKKKINFALDHRAKFYLKDLVRGPGILKFYIPSQQLLFASRIDLYRGNHLEVIYPETYKKHDRRKDMRLEPLVPVMFNLNGFKKECYDVSKGGFSFIINSMEYKKFKFKSDQEFECAIDFPFKKVKIIAKIVNLHNLKPFELERFPYGVKKVSIQTVESDLYMDSIDKLVSGMRKLLADLV